MDSFEHTATWARTLAVQKKDPHERHRARLRTAYLQTRERVRHLVSEIGKDLPNFTVHDMTHIDALWEYCDLIAGNEFPLTPAEGFALGLAFLVHDAGMTVRAYRGGVAEVRGLQLWTDTFSAYRSRNPDISDETISSWATADILRILHADKAGSLLQQGWPQVDGSVEYLLEDAELRASYGQIAGEVAASHWSDVQSLRQKLDKHIGAPSFLPPAWDCDVFKLASLLRLCDAAQIDAGRAPAFLRSLRGIGGLSGDHWLFQSVLTRPKLIAGQLVYSATRSLAEDEAGAWWLAYDIVKGIDRVNSPAFCRHLRG